MRYHKQVFFPDWANCHLRCVINGINSLEWQYTSHSLDNIKDREYNIKDLLLYIKDLFFNVEDVFEFYADNNIINRVCFRVPYKNGLDIILVVGDRKKLITVYFNDSKDKHETLNENLYCKG